MDTSAAGQGDLDATITHHGQKVHTQREALGDGKFRYTFFPGETGHYEVKATFNNDNIPGNCLVGGKVMVAQRIQSILSDPYGRHVNFCSVFFQSGAGEKGGGGGYF